MSRSTVSTSNIIRRTDKHPGVKVLPWRRVVQRTFGWMAGWKCLVRDYERRLDVSQAMIHVALGSLMPRAGSSIPEHSQTHS